MTPKSTQRLTAVLVGSSMYHAAYWLMQRDYIITSRFPLAGIDPDGNPFRAFRCYKPSDAIELRGREFSRVVQIDQPDFTAVCEAYQQIRA